MSSSFNLMEKNVTICNEISLVYKFHCAYPDIMVTDILFRVAIYILDNFHLMASCYT